jgi:hypothetical protein
MKISFFLSLRGAQRRSNPARWIATPGYAGLAMAKVRAA